MDEIKKPEIIGCLGEKLGMSQLAIDKNKKAIPVTIIWVGKNYVSQIKRKEKEGYNSCQLSFKDCPAKSLTLPKLKHLQKNGISPKKYLVEIRDMGFFFTEGSKVDLSLFRKGKKIKISANTKGKGFAGPIKRHGFSRGPMTHGASPPHRRQGSLCSGGRGKGQNVIKGKKMAGHMGNRKVTKMTVLEFVDEEKEIIAVRGSVPGPRGRLIVLKQLLE